MLNGCSFRKGVRVPSSVPGGRGLGSASGGWWGGGLPVKNKGNSGKARQFPKALGKSDSLPATPRDCLSKTKNYQYQY